MVLLTVRVSCVHCVISLSVTSREEHRLRVFESGVLKKVFGHQRWELTGDWRRLHGEKLHVYICYLFLFFCVIYRYNLLLV
jgi:hypothetical protein